MYTQIHVYWRHGFDIKPQINKLLMDWTIQAEMPYYIKSKFSDCTTIRNCITLTLTRHHREWRPFYFGILFIILKLQGLL